MKSHGASRKFLFALGQLLAYVSMWNAFVVVGGFKGGIGPAEKLKFFLLIGVACLFAFGSMVLLRGKDRSSNSWVPIVGLMIVGSTAAIITPVLASARAASTYARCISNVKQLATGMQIYSADWDDRFPPAEKWHDLIGQSLRSDGRDINCPAAKTPFSYAMNQAMSKVKWTEMEDPQNTVLMFEFWSANPNQLGGKASFIGPHGGIGSVGRADGSATRIKPGDSKFRWNP